MGTVEEKLKSRTFWFAAVWTVLVAFGMVLHLLKVEVPLTTLITTAGIVVAAYVGGEKLIDNTKMRKNGSG